MYQNITTECMTSRKWYVYSNNEYYVVVIIKELQKHLEQRDSTKSNSIKGVPKTFWTKMTITELNTTFKATNYFEKDNTYLKI